MKPRVFVSSTFYDLKYIREDLSNFIKDYNFEPIMFEDGDIGYTPGKQLDKSCYNAMKNTDMVILIIGGEYGSPASGETKDDFKEYISITRNEFRAAFDAGIPIYIFIDSNIYSEYGIYEANYEDIEENGLRVKFKSTKNINVFRFIKEIYTFSDKPIIEFKRSIDIKTFLSKQWADMFKNYLRLLRNEREKTSLQSTVSDMEALIKQMSIMIDAVGKKVLNDNDKKQYDNIIKKQYDVEVNRIVRIITNSLKLRLNTSSPHITEIPHRNILIDKLLNSICNSYKAYQRELSKHDYDVEQTHEELADIFFRFLVSEDLFLLQYSSFFIESIPNIARSLENSTIRSQVFSRLLKESNYSRIFQPINSIKDK